MVKPGYKETEIGVIPEEWEVSYITRFGDIVSGGTPSTTVKEYWDGNIAWCTPTDITSTKGNSIKKTQKKITAKGLSNSAASLLPAGSLLICTRATIGESKINTIPMATNQGFKNVVSNGSCIGYLFYLLQTKKKQMMEKAIGSTFLEISKSALCSIPLPYPPLPEQQRIAEVLSDVDGMISSLEMLIEKKKAIKQGMMEQLLTGKVRLPGFEGEWETVTLGEVSHIVRGGSPRPIQDYLSKDNSGINWIKIGDVKPEDKYIEHTQEKIIYEGVSRSRYVRKGDFILSNSMSFGRPYILKLDGCIHDGWLAIQDYQDSFDVDFLYYVLSSNYVFNQYIQMAAGSSVQNLNVEKVKKLVLQRPSIEEQIEIADCLSSLDTEISSALRVLDKQNIFKQSVIQSLLAGTIRVM